MINSIRKSRCWLGLIIALMTVISIYILDCGSKTVILVRHAERGQGDDPSLTTEGQARAEELAEILAEAGVSRIFTTQFIRTRQTAQPLANMLDITPQVINLDTSNVPTYVDELTSRIRSSNGRVVVVVSHSNTIPLVIEELGAGTIPAISEIEFDNIYIVTLPKWFGTPRLIRARYGK